MGRSTEDDSRKIPAAPWYARRLDGDRIRDLFVSAAPASTHEEERAQFESMAARALDALGQAGLSPFHIVSGWIHLARSPGWDWRKHLARVFGASGPLPITAVLQPPVRQFQFCAMQLHAVQLARQSGVWHGNVAEPAAATVLRHGARHLRLMSIAPRQGLPVAAPFSDLAYDMFAQAGHALTARGLTFKDVVRTWIYVQDIEHNYQSVNQARNRYFAEQNLTRLPASTGIGGALPGAAAPVAMDLYAVAGEGDVRVEAIGPGAMGEASVYGSAFARGSRLVEPSRTTLYISGTASVDQAGNVVSPGDIDGQLACMFGNLRALLEAEGMAFHHALSAKAYLKQASFRSAYARVAAEFGLPIDLPAVEVVADICRPEWLCEVELCAARAT